MAFVLQFRNNDGVTQIGNGVIPLALIARGTATATTSHPLTDRTKYFDLPYTGSYPVLAIYIRYDGGTIRRFGGVVGHARSGNNWTSRVAITWPSPTAPPAGTYDFEWFVYDKPLQSSPPGWKTRVRDLDGQVIFDTSFPLIDVVDQPIGIAATQYLYGPGKYAVAGFGLFAVTDQTDTDEQGNSTQIYTASMEGYSSIPNGVLFDNRLIAAGQNQGSPWLPSGGLDGAGSAQSPLIIRVP